MTRRLLTVLACAVVLICSGAQARPVGPSTLNCGFYAELDRRCGCGGRDHYFLDYGQRYCERVVHATGWSPAGLRWRAHTLSCLKNELARALARSPHRCDCARVRTLAFDSHVQCYTLKAASVCALPLSDVRKIYQIIDTADLIDPAGFKQVLGVTLACVRQNGNAGARGDDPTQ